MQQRSSRLSVTSQGPQKQLQRDVSKQAEKTTNAIQETDVFKRLAAAQRQLERGTSIPTLLAISLLTGLTFGTVFQVTHNQGLLPVSSSSLSHGKTLDFLHVLLASFRKRSR